jgi:hypothetical protein
MTSKASDTLTTQAATDPAGDRAASTRAEFHAFAGSPREVAIGLFALPPDVVTGSFYAFLMQGSGGAEVRLFTRGDADSGHGSVEVWRGPGLSDLPGLIAGLLMARTAEQSPRESVVSALRDCGEFQPLGIVPCPTTARGAFGHPIRPLRGEEFIQAYVVTIWEE